MRRKLRVLKYIPVHRAGIEVATIGSQPLTTEARSLGMVITKIFIAENIFERDDGYCYSHNSRFGREDEVLIRKELAKIAKERGADIVTDYTINVFADPFDLSGKSMKYFAMGEAWKVNYRLVL